MRWVRVSTAGRDTGPPDSRAFLIRSPGFNSPFFVPPSSFFWLRLTLFLIPEESKNRRVGSRIHDSMDPVLQAEDVTPGTKRSGPSPGRATGRELAPRRLRLLADLELDRVGRVRRERILRVAAPVLGVDLLADDLDQRVAAGRDP